jgi:hypothetical protein
MSITSSPGSTATLAQRMRRPLAALIFVALFGAGHGTPWLAPAAAAEAAAVASEERVKAAFLHKFLNYAEWPQPVLARAEDPYVIGVAGDDGVADELARIAAGRTVNNRGVVVKRVLPGESLADLHMLFIGHGEQARQAQWLRQARGRAILTVTDADGALEQGAMINFRILEERVRFEISVDAVEQGRLRLSSRLFAIATNVVKGSR